MEKPVYNLTKPNQSLFALIAALVLGLVLLLVPTTAAHAQEINPAPGTYSFGSTSEFSPYATLSQGTSSGSLAPTGDSQMVGVVVVVALVIVAAGIVLVTVRMGRKKG